MTFELRPASHEAFYERRISAQIRRQQEMNDANRRPRVSDKERTRCRRQIETKREMMEIERQHKEIWE